MFFVYKNAVKLSLIYWLIDRILMPSLAVFQLYHGVINLLELIIIVINKCWKIDEVSTYYQNTVTPF